MGIALVQTASLGSTSNGSSQQTLAFGVNPTVGNYIVAWAWGWNGGNDNPATFSDTGANTYTIPAGASQRPGGGLWVCCGHAKVATAGANFKVTATQVAGGSIMVMACEFSGVAASSPLDGAAVGTTGTTGVPAPGNLSFTAGDLVVAVMGRNSTTYLGSTPTGFTRADFQNDGTNFEVGEGIYAIDPASPSDPAWTTSTTSWAAAQFALLADVAGGGGGGGAPGGGGGGSSTGFQKPVAEGWT